MTTRHRSLAGGLTLAAALLTVLAGCGSDAGTDPGAGTGTAARPAQVGAGSVSSFAELFVGYDADYDHIGTPAALAARSKLVVQGRIARIDKGRTFGISATDPVAETRIVLVFTVDKVLNGGALAGKAGGTVYVELPAPGGAAAEVFDRSAPKTSDAVLYLSPAATAADTAIVNPDAGRPAGQPLYQPVNPQGFVIDAGTAVVQVLERHEFPGANLGDFVPAAKKQFPSARHVS